MTPVNQIELAPWHPRKTFENIDAIGESIIEKGQMQPICVSPRDGKYLLAFGGRRLSGAKARGLTEIRAEIWELTDLELKFWQARELYHTQPLRELPESDAFYRYLFHEAVNERIASLHRATKPLCPRCYQCPDHPRGGVGGCPAFLSYEAFAEMIGREVDKSTISRAFTRDIFREEIPEIKELELPSPAKTIPVFYGLLKDNILNTEETIALATKTADGELGTLTDGQKIGGYGPVKTLNMIRSYLRRDNEDKISEKVRHDIIHTAGYGPAEAEYDIQKTEPIKPPETMLDIGFKLEHNIFVLSQMLREYSISEIPEWRQQTIVGALQRLNNTITEILKSLGISNIIEGKVIK